ncbi:MAG: hypothetical protein QME45_12410 [Clostridiales bacterium]|nr:hypothetical protein [Clostridiales bacterium]HBM80411.1 hypothetical protein [Clostridiaceae bacterium]
MEYDNMLDGLFYGVYCMRPDEVRMSFEYIGEGICRAVYAIDERFVAKFATCMDGFDQCGLEYKIYSTCKDRYKKYLCPVVWYRPGMVVMPRAVPITEFIEGDKYDISILGGGAVRDLKRLSKKYDLLFEDIESPTSWGILMGRPCLIDYGCTN